MPGFDFLNATKMASAEAGRPPTPTLSQIMGRAQSGGEHVFGGRYAPPTIYGAKPDRTNPRGTPQMRSAARRGKGKGRRSRTRRRMRRA